MGGVVDTETNGEIRETSVKQSGESQKKDGSLSPCLWDSGELQWQTGKVLLSPAESRIVRALLSAESRLVTRASLAAIADSDPRHGLDTHVYRLRHKLTALDGLELETVPKRGFRLHVRCVH
jgi:DNA-binding winged helix-turn-helix (wHTH) protein